MKDSPRVRPSLMQYFEAIWPFDWLDGLKGALPREIIGKAQYPKVLAWIQRLRKAVAAAKTSAPKPAMLQGPDAARRIPSADFAEPQGGVDEDDPLNLQKGQQVEVWPTDSGFRHHDTGALVALNETEVVLKTQSTAAGKQVRLHFPRTDFRIQAAQSGAEPRL